MDLQGLEVAQVRKAVATKDKKALKYSALLEQNEKTKGSMSCSLSKGFKVCLNKILHKGFKTLLQSLDDPLGLFHPKQTDSNRIVWQAVGIQHREVSTLKKMKHSLYYASPLGHRGKGDAG